MYEYVHLRVHGCVWCVSVRFDVCMRTCVVRLRVSVTEDLFTMGRSDGEARRQAARSKNFASVLNPARTSE
jgi:hypothetical protein